MTDEMNNTQEEEKSTEWKWHQPTNQVWGIALIIVGLLFMVSSLGIYHIPFYNWWAIFILVPGINMLINAWQIYQEEGQTSDNVNRKALWGGVLVLISFTFFFNLNWTFFFPIVLIGVGVYILLMHR
jgi:hypothetical protein